MKVVYRICLLLSIFFLKPCAHAQLINQMTVKDGLGGRQLFKVIQDEKGFIWIANQFGIDRYDGVNIKNYPLDIMQNGSSPFRSLKLTTDKNNEIWAYTDNGIVYQYNKSEDRFVAYTYLKRFVKNLIFDANNRLWFVTHTELSYLDKNNCKIYIEQKAKDEFYKSIVTYDASHILVQTDKNIYKFNIESGKSEKLLSLWQESNLSIESFLYDKSVNGLWVGTLEKGLYYYNLANQKLIHIVDLGLESYPILSLCKLNDNCLLVGTDGIGLVLVNAKTLKIEKKYNKEGRRNEFLGGGAINNIFKDKDDKIWVSTYSGGVYILDYSVQGFKTIKKEEGSVPHLNQNVVCDILEDSSGQLWFATNNNICIWNAKQNVWKHILTAKNVLTLYEDSRNSIWVGTYSSGVLQLDKEGNVIRKFINDGNGGNQLGTNFIYAIVEDSKGNMWFGGKKKGGLTRYDIHNNTFSRVDINQVNHIINRNQNTILVSSETGLFEVDIQSLTLKKNK